jgi:hypothetical protein
MNSERVAILSGVIGVLGMISRAAPEILTVRLANTLFEQGPPNWLPTFGTVGRTVLLYDHATIAVGALLMIVPVVGFGYYLGRGVDLDEEYRRVFGAITTGTTVPLIAAWGGGIGTVFFGIFGGFDVVFLTVFALRLFVTVSVPVIIGVFAGAALAHFIETDYSPSEPDDTNDIVSTGD